MSEDPLRDAHDPARFRAMGHTLVDRLADHLEASRDGAMPVLPALDRRDLDAAWRDARPRLPELVERTLDASLHLHHPGYVGHQISVPSPTAALATLVAATLNNGMAVFETGPAATAMERAVIRWLNDRIGFGDDADGVLTHGGSLGNLTALLSARQAVADMDPWRNGGCDRLAIIVGSEAHYCSSRAAHIMGLGDDGVIVVPEQAFQMRGDALEAAFNRANGRTVMAVVASACCTATGTYDPLPELADVCARHGAWLHVDGAHGATAALSPTHRHLVDGIERADSVVWDLHKMMMVPALSTAVLFADARSSYQTFAHAASYLYTRQRDEHDLSHRTVECTKRMLAFEVMALLGEHGEEVFSTFVDHTYGLARTFGELVQADPRFELACAPQSNIVCFRPLDAEVPVVREQVVRRGEFYLVQAKLRGEDWLRVTLMNPATTPADLERLLDACAAPPEA